MVFDCLDTYSSGVLLGVAATLCVYVWGNVIHLIFSSNDCNLYDGNTYCYRCNKKLTLQEGIYVRKESSNDNVLVEEQDSESE